MRRHMGLSLLCLLGNTHAVLCKGASVRKLLSIPVTNRRPLFIRGGSNVSPSSNSEFTTPSPSSGLPVSESLGIDHEFMTSSTPIESPDSEMPTPNNQNDEAPSSEPEIVTKAQRTPLDTLNLLVTESNNLFFSEHGRCGVANRKSQRCREGYQVAAMTNTFAGLTCALAMVPEAVSVALLAGLSPLVGLWTSVIMGGTAAVCGERGGPITGASRACALVVASLVKTKSVDHVPLAVALAALFQFFVGHFRLAKYIRLVPHPVMMGFVNGLSIVIFRTQLEHVSASLLNGPALAATAGLAGLTAGLVKYLPLLSAKIPAPSLVAVGVAMAAAKLLNLPAATLGDMSGGGEAFKGGLSALPRLSVPGLAALAQYPSGGVKGAAALLCDVAPFAAAMACVGLIESLLTLQIVDTLVDDGTHSSMSAECKAQSVANAASAFTGGMGGCALLGQSLVNLDGGGTARLAGVVMSGALAFSLLFAAPLLAAVPVASLVGLMAVVCHSMFSWSLLNVLGRIPGKDAVVLLLVSATVVLKDLGTAVVVGTVCSSLAFAWEMSTLLKAPMRYTESVHGYDTVGGDAFKTAQVFSVEGNVFFGSAHQFCALFDGEALASGPPLVFIDFGNARVLDHSGVNAINSVCRRLGAVGKKVVLRRLSPDVSDMLKHASGTSTGRSPPPFQIVESKKESDPRYSTAVDR